MVGIVIVSHSSKIAEGTRDLAEQMADKNIRIMAAGGMADGEIGTDVIRISQAIAEANAGDGVVVLADLGSAILSAQTAIELLEEDIRDLVKVADAPIVEGAIAAAIQATIGGSLEEVAAAAETAREMNKL